MTTQPGPGTRRIRGPHHACRILMMRRQCGLPRTRAPGAVDMRGMSVGPAARTRKQPPAKSGDPLAAGSLWAIQLATNLLAGLGGPASEAIEAEPSEEGRRQRVPFHGHIGRTDVRIAPPSANLQRTRQMRRAPARRRWSPPQSRWVPCARWWIPSETPPSSARLPSAASDSQIESAGMATKRKSGDRAGDCGCSIRDTLDGRPG
jgi:hypothetical protein